MSAVSTSESTPDQAPAPAEYKVRVLLVDDQRIIVEAVRRMLAAHADIEFHFCLDPHAALAQAVAVRPTVILQDLVLPGFDGFDLIRAYRAEAALGDVPVIVLSTKEEASTKAHSFALGANDYLVKLPDQLELVARVRHHSRGYISQLQRDAAYSALRASQDELARVNEELRKLATLDGLTGIGNRRRFDDVARTEWQRGRRTAAPLSMLLCDVDHFKLFNDHFGHPAGDGCLKRVADALNGQLKRPADVAARYGGEEARTNADADGALLDRVAMPDEAGRKLLVQAAETMRLTARGYTRILRVARTVADLAGGDAIGRVHVAEALSYRRRPPVN